MHVELHPLLFGNLLVQDLRFKQIFLFASMRLYALVKINTLVCDHLDKLISTLA